MSNVDSDTKEAIPVLAIKDILSKVNDLVSTCGETVKKKIIYQMADIEIERRVTAVANAIAKLEALRLEAKKIKPSHTGFTATGEPVGEATYSKEQVDLLRKNSESASKIENAIERAFTHNDFSKVFELSQK